MNKRVHFVGIGGSGMLPLAILAAKKGYSVSGSDRSFTDEKIAWLEKSDIHVFRTPSENNLTGCEKIIFSTAIGPDHPERRRAVRMSEEGEAEILHRMDFLNVLVEGDGVRIGIAGTHGKTSTSSLFGFVLNELGYDPTIIVGGKPLYLPDGVRNGEGGISVFETDESDGSFLTSNANLRICLNVDNDHLEYYGSMEKLCEAFSRFAGESEISVLNGNDDVLKKINESNCIHFYEKKNDSDADGDDKISYAGSFRDLTDHLDVYRESRTREYLGLITMKIPGRHFALNALSVMALLDSAVEAGYIDKKNYSPGKAIEAINTFPGVERRIEKIACVNSVDVYDDYGHHPSEIKAVMKALRGRLKEGGRLFIVFQPHRYSRTEEHFKEFASSLLEADFVYLMPLYSAGEEPRKGVSSRLIGDAMMSKCIYLDDDNFSSIFERTSPGDTIVFQGAGDISYRIRKFLKSSKQTTV